MRTISSILAAILLLTVSSASHAQLKKDTNVKMSQALTHSNKLQSLVGLLGLDPTKFSMSHSYSMMFSSVGGHSFSQGLYLNTMKYQFSDPLSMFVQVGFSHQPFGNLGNDNLQTRNQLFLSGAGLEYKPSENFKLQFQFSQTPGSLYPSRYRLNPFNRFDSFESKKEKP